MAITIASTHPSWYSEARSPNVASAARAKRERRSVAQEVIQILSQVADQAAPLSILDLQGLGKEVWRGVDAARHVGRERRGWD